MKYVETTGELIKILSILPADCMLIGEEGNTGFMVGGLDNYHNVYTECGDERLGIVIEMPEEGYLPERYAGQEQEAGEQEAQRSKGNVVSIFK